MYCINRFIVYNRPATLSDFPILYDLGHSMSDFCTISCLLSDQGLKIPKSDLFYELKPVSVRKGGEGGSYQSVCTNKQTNCTGRHCCILLMHSTSLVVTQQILGGRIGGEGTPSLPKIQTNSKSNWPMQATHCVACILILETILILLQLS